MADPQAIGKSFVDYYYAMFDQDRSKLAPLYRAESMLTFEAQPFVGVQAISEKLTSLPFQRIQHKVNTVDVQPANPQIGSLLVSVTGALMFDQESNPQQFCQTFQLVPDGSGSYFVFNDIFRLCFAGV
ncbi:Nuclear transport factor 2 [Borealophlyctis nickersoniae]|nr:Nuclear transport factor 2 [Borealophlyctis nickersoniae]